VAQVNQFGMRFFEAGMPPFLNLLYQLTVRTDVGLIIQFGAFFGIGRLVVLA